MFPDWDWSQIFNFALNAVTGIELAFVGTVILIWRFTRLKTPSDMRDFIFSLVPVMFSLVGWALGNMYEIWSGGNQPWATLPFRLMLGGALGFQAFKLLKYMKSGIRPVLVEAEYILLVEDNLPLARIYRTVLTNAGYKTEIANNGADALTLMNFESPVMAIVDLGLPDMTGADLVRKMRQAGFNKPVMCLSGSHDTGRYADLFKLSLLKPVQRDELIAAVIDCLKPDLTVPVKEASK